MDAPTDALDPDELGPSPLPRLREEIAERVAGREPALIEYAKTAIVLDALERATAISTPEQALRALRDMRPAHDCGARGHAA